MKDASADAERVRSATIRGLETAWYESGPEDADVLLFIHGYLDTPDAWSLQARPFAEQYRVIRPFGRGIGGSQEPADRRRYGAYSILLDHLELLRLADPERKRSVHVVGHDVGGVHAWLLASHPQTNLKSVTIINSVHPKQYLRRLFWPRQIVKSWYIAAMQVPMLSEAMLSLFHRRIIDSLISEGWRSPDHDLGIREFDQAALNAMNQYRQFVRDIPHFLREKALPVAAPVLVISSEEDRYLETPMAPEFADIAKNVTVRVVKGGHWIHREQAERINRLIADFVSAHP